MKNIIVLLFCLSAVFAQQNAYGQCICSFVTLVEQDPDDPCCLTIKICNQFTVNSNCLGVPFETVQFVSNNFPPQIAEVTSAVGGPGITATVSNPYTVTFNTGIPFNSQLSECLFAGDYIKVGRVCLGNAAEATTGYEVSIISTAGGTCVLDVGEFPIACQEPTLCPDNVVQNGNFQQGLIGGDLNTVGNVDFWSPIPFSAGGSGLSSPQAIAGIGCAAPGSIQMWGNQVVGEGIRQSMNFMAGQGYDLSFCGEYLPMPNTQPNARLRFRATNNPNLIYQQSSGYLPCNLPDCEEIFLSPILPLGWNSFTAPVWTPQNNYTHLVVTVWNDFNVDNPKFVSWARVDDICISPTSSNCNALFSWQRFLRIPCYGIQFTDQSTGTAPLSYCWDLDGDPSTCEYTTSNFVHQFPGCGNYPVCLTITDADGCMDTYCNIITVREGLPPTITCPANMTVSTDPGKCTAFVNPAVTAVDNCDPNPTITWILSGATMGDNVQMEYNIGVTVVTATATDNCDNSSSCTFEITVVDNEPPTIQCPPNQTVQVLGCSDGSVVTFDQPIVTDNCPGVTYICDSPFQSGDFFPCGTTTITCTATDAAGLTASCSHSITVNGCDNCAEVVSSSMECTDIEGCFHFSIQLANLTSLPFCDAFVNMTGTGLTWYAFDCSTGIVSGQICLPAPYPLQLPVAVNVTFPGCGGSSGTIVLQPDAAQGKDAVVSTLSPNNNFGNALEINAQRWTIGGAWFTSRAYLDFDWSAIPAGATVTSATLELTGATGTFNNYLFPCLEGNNDMFLKLVSAPWDEATVTWNTKPATSSNPAHQLSIPPICLPGNGQHGHLSADVTALVAAILSNPGAYHGFELSLQVETPNQYRAYIARSSDHPDPMSHPKLTVQFGAVLSCPLPVSLHTPCCEEITVEDATACKTAPTLQMPLLASPEIIAAAVQVDWYVDVHCDGQNVLFYQSSPTWQDLSLLPSALPADVSDLCVYAVVTLAGHPCTTLTSNTAEVTLCAPPACSVLNSAQSYCYTGSAIPVLPLTVQLAGNDCDGDVQWYLNGSPIPGATSSTYQPSAVTHVAGSNGDCFTTYQYAAHVTGVCGTRVCAATITVYNGDADPGSLDLTHPLISQPFCPGQDATLEFTPDCPQNGEWTWYLSQTGASGPFSEINGAGNQNPHYNTNQLFQSTWYEVEVKNGVCPPDRIPYFIEIKGPLSITQFSAEADDVCDPTNVLMEITVAPPPTADCPYRIHWYKDGVLLHTSTTTSATASYLHADGGPYAGNYYAVVEDECCGRQLKSPVITIGEPMQVLMIAPCFRCNDEIVTLEGVVLNPPPGTSCTYKWYKDGVEIIGETGLTINVNMGDATYTFEATCGPCTKSVSYFLRQCGIPLVPICLCSMLADDVAMGFMYNPVAPLVYEFMPIAPLQSCDEVTWNWGDGSPLVTSSGTNAVQHTFVQAGSWPISMAVSRTDSSGTACTETFQMIIVGSMNASLQPIQVQVSPNPVSQDLRIVFNEPLRKDMKLAVVNEAGAILRQQDLPGGLKENTISLAALPAGAYFLQLQDVGRVVWTQKIIKQ